MSHLTQDYQIEWNGLTMGTDTAYDLVGIIGAGIPSVRSNDIPKLDDHGAFPGRRELLQPRTWNLEVDIVATDVQDLHSKVNAFKAACLPSEFVRPLYLRIAGAGWGLSYEDVTVSYGFARQLTCNIGTLVNANIQKAYLQIECPDPRIYSETEQSASGVPLEEGTGGWVFPWTFPWSFGTVTTGQIAVDNQGNFTSSPRMVINGPATTPRIQNLNTGEFIQLDTTIETGSTLELNFHDKTAILDGSAQRWNFRHFGSSWFPLYPGVNPIQYSIAAGDGQLDIYWRHAWL